MDFAQAEAGFSHRYFAQWRFCYAINLHLVFKEKTYIKTTFNLHINKLIASLLINWINFTQTIKIIYY